jgi:Golgi phosphoprotein 3 (GPP34)
MAVGVGASLRDLDRSVLTGYIEDKGGEASPLKAHHPDPLLDDALTRAAGRGWSQLVFRGGRTRRAVLDQLVAAGWIHGQHRRMLGLVPARVDVYDEYMVEGLAHRVTDALRNILADQPAEPRSLAVGLIAVQAQLPAVSSFTDDRHDRDRLHEMTLATIEPILGLYNAIHTHCADVRSGSAWDGGV